MEVMRNGKKPILKGSLTGYAKPGQLLAIIGPSGCGKSTLLDAFSRYLNAREIEWTLWCYGFPHRVIGNIFSVVPFIIMIYLIPAGAIVYHLSGLHKGPEHFLYFVFVLFLLVLGVESLMLVLGSMFPNFVAEVIIASGVLGVMILTGEFYRRPNDLPKPLWKYPFYHVSFLTYAFQGSFKSEFDGLLLTLNQGGGAKTTSSEEILAKTWHVQLGHSKWVDLIIMFRMIVLYQAMFLVNAKSKGEVETYVKAWFYVNNNPKRTLKGIFF